MTLFSKILLEKLRFHQIYIQLCDFRGIKALTTAVTEQTMWFTAKDVDALQACHWRLAHWQLHSGNAILTDNKKCIQAAFLCPPLHFPLSYSLIVIILILCCIGPSSQWASNNLLPHITPVS